MYYQTTQISDTVKAAADTVSKALQPGDALHKITFDPANILRGDGILISVVGYLIVFLALILLYLVFTNITKLLNFNLRKRLKAEGKGEEIKDEDIEISGEVNAAIAMALYLHFEEVHDFESTVLTIKKVQRPYSPWSSKIYGLRELPRK